MHLHVENGDSAGTRFELNRDHPCVIGTDPGCDLRLSDPAVRPQHAVVKALKDRGFGIKSLAPGLRHNGHEVEAAPLQEGDWVEIGTTRIQYGEQAQNGFKVAGFRILGELGKGGMGMVYRAEQTSLHRQVALKVLSRELTRDPAFVAKFVAEARAAAKLSHPNVVQVFDVDHDGDTYYYAMELMSHGSLETWLRKHGRMPVDRALRAILEAAAGLAYAESLGVVHRDIKPDNLMLDQHETVKIADLGLAHTGDGSSERAAGTPHFMAPEQALRRPLDHRTDLYALGCTFYRLVTGRTPFQGSTVKDILRAQVHDQAEPANKVVPEVPAAVAAIIQRLMEKDAADRYQSAGELVEQLQQLLAPPARRGLWIGLAAAGVLAAGGAIIWAATRPEKIVTIEQQYADNPEALRLARENDELKKQIGEVRAEVALWRVQTEHRDDAALAAALGRLETEHAGTAAAGQANTLRRQLETAIARREAEQRTVAASLATAIAALKQDVAQALGAADYQKALTHTGREQPNEIARHDDWRSAVAEQQRAVRDAVHAHWERLLGAAQQARVNRDPDALVAALVPMRAALDEQNGWPKAALTDQAARREELKAAENAVGELRDAATTEQWQQLEQLLAGDVGAALGRQDFAAANAALTTFAADRPELPSRQRAAALAAVLAKAERCAALLTAPPAPLNLVGDEGVAFQVTRWDRAAGQFVVVETKRGAKETSIAQQTLQAAQWNSLLAQLTGAEEGDRHCLHGMLLVCGHLRAGPGYLQALRADSDDSGTGDHGYPLGPGAIERLLRDVPASEVDGWQSTLRHELQACRSFAAGCRALSERRNRGAASHFERLLAEFPHSLIVAAMP